MRGVRKISRLARKRAGAAQAHVRLRCFSNTTSGQAPAQQAQAPAPSPSAGGSQNRKPHIYLGTMTFAWSQASRTVDDDAAKGMLQLFLRTGGTRVDTARIYAGGQTEPMLGRVCASLPPSERNKLRVSTKVHPSGPGGLTRSGILGQVATSLRAMGSADGDTPNKQWLRPLEELYLHQPDSEAALAESLETVHHLVEKGEVKRLGLSNYHVSEVDRCLELCHKHGWTPPSVYQGLYNPLNRLVEKELLPVLRDGNVAFVAYNPLAAGMLTGKHSKAGDTPAAGRFRDNPNYLPRFYTDGNFEAVHQLSQACAEHDIAMVNATYQWLMHHSALKGKRDDGLLLGASSVAQLDQNLSALVLTHRLPPSLVEAFDACAGIVEAGGDSVFPYWRGYSQDHPGRESLDQGASYSAAASSTSAAGRQ